MCKFWSAILTRDRRVLWDRDISSHEELIRKFGLKDDKLADRDFVRVEVTPKTGKLASKKKSDWVLKIDELDTLPDWYTNDTRGNDKLIWAEWKSAMEQTLWGFELSKIEDVLNEIRRIQYLKQLGEPLPEWNLSNRPARAAARDAAWDAARDAAWNAARDAAGDAAGDAARDAAIYCVVAILPDNKIEAKHRQHMNDRMEVWRRGYALLCDVDGRMYVYGVGEGEVRQ